MFWRSKSRSVGSLYPCQHSRCPLVALMTRSALFANITSAVSTSTVRLTSRKRRDVGVQVCVWHDVTFWNGFMLYFSSTLNHSVLFSCCTSVHLLATASLLHMYYSCCGCRLIAVIDWQLKDVSGGLETVGVMSEDDTRGTDLRLLYYILWLGCDLISRTLESHDVHNYLAA